MVGTNNIVASNRRMMARARKRGEIGEDDMYDDDTGVVTAPIAPLIKAQKEAERARGNQAASILVPKKKSGIAASEKKALKPKSGAAAQEQLAGKKRTSKAQARAQKAGAPSGKAKQPAYEEDDEFDIAPAAGGDSDDDDDEDNVDFDDQDDYDDEDSYGDDSDIDDDDDFETKARKHKSAMLREGAIADAEAKTERNRQAPVQPFADMAEKSQYLEYGADTAQSGAVTGAAPVGAKGGQSVEELKDRISETVRVLSNFSEQREEDRSREEYMELLRADLIELHEYNEFLMDRVLEIFAPHEAVEFLDAMEKERPLTLRCNMLKAKRRDLVQNLTKRGISVEPLEKWTKVGLQVFDHKVNVGATMEYLAGQYMVQAAASFLPVMALAPQEGEKILDMAAAPGGKTTHICQLMKNTGIVVANDVSEARCKSLSANIQRLGITNAIVTNYDGVGFQRVMHHFDRILLDSPCTGTGVISRDKSIKTSKELADVQRVSLQQRKLLLEAIDCLKVGGVVVYSTCSWLVEENEAVVDYALARRDVEIVEMGLPFGRPGFTKYRHNRFAASVEHTRRYFPHVHNMDGFYVAKLRKISDKGCIDLNTINKTVGGGNENGANHTGRKLNHQQTVMPKREGAAEAPKEGKKREKKQKEQRVEEVATTPAEYNPNLSRPPKMVKTGAPQKKKQRRE